MLHLSPYSPEARRPRPAEPPAPRPWQGPDGRTQRLAYAREVAKRVLIGVYSDGFIHAGNLAYLSLVALFPFFILAASVASLIGRTDDGIAAVNAFLYAVPADVAVVLRPAIESVIHARADSGVVWLGLLVALWTVGSLIETIRDILRRAYGVTGGLPFWRYRLRAIGIIVISVIAAMTAFSVQVALTGIDQFLVRLLPFADNAIAFVNATKLLPFGLLTLALVALFYSLTPERYRKGRFPKWPGPVLTALWWYGTLMLLPWALSHLAHYDLTYGSLAGVMITLIFFFLVGLGVVIGAELNAALADFPPHAPPGRPETQEVDAHDRIDGRKEGPHYGAGQ